MGTERTRIDLAASRSGRGRRDLKDRELLPAANLPRHATVSASMLPLWSAFKKSPQSRASLTLSVGLKTTPTPTLPCLSCSTARRKTRETRAWHIPHKTLRRSLARFRPRCDVQSSFVACEGRGPPPSHSQSFLPWDRCWHALGPACRAGAGTAGSVWGGSYRGPWSCSTQTATSSPAGRPGADTLPPSPAPALSRALGGTRAGDDRGSRLPAASAPGNFRRRLTTRFADNRQIELQFAGSHKKKKSLQSDLARGKGKKIPG